MDIIQKTLEENNNNLAYLILNILKENNQLEKDFYEDKLKLLKNKIDKNIIPKDFEELDLNLYEDVRLMEQNKGIKN